MVKRGKSSGNRKNLVIVLIIIVIVVALYFIFRSPTVCFNEKCFNVELAETQEEYTQGLKFRESLAESKGMLFVFNRPGKYIFWMRDALIPLDMIWITESGKVSFIKENAQPCIDYDSGDECPTFTPDENYEPALYVLEINAGGVDKYNIEIGDSAKVKL